MKRLLLGCLIGMAVTAPSLWALRTERPPEFTQVEWNSNTLTQLNNWLLQAWNVLNGNYAFDVVTVDPDGSRRGVAGEAVVYNNAGTVVLCVNTNDATDWDCATLAD